MSNRYFTPIILVADYMTKASYGSKFNEFRQQIMKFSPTAACQLITIRMRKSW